MAMPGYGMPLGHVGTEGYAVGGASSSVASLSHPSLSSSGQRKGALCKYYQQGVTCNAGDSCTYAHGIHELAGGFKQRLCKFFNQTGSCIKGDSCTYAHGVHELLVGEALAGAPARPEEPDPAESAKILPLLSGIASWASSEEDQSYKASLCRLWELA